MIMCPECGGVWHPGTPETHRLDCPERPERRQRRMEERVDRILVILEAWSAAHRGDSVRHLTEEGPRT